MKTKNHIPEFKNEVEEQEFWQQNDTANFIDWKQAKKVRFPNLKPSGQHLIRRMQGVRLSVYIMLPLKIHYCLERFIKYLKVT